MRPSFIESFKVLFLVDIFTTPPIASEPWIDDNGPDATSIFDIKFVSKL